MKIRNFGMALGATSLVVAIAGCGTHNTNTAAGKTVATVGKASVTTAQLANFVSGTELFQGTTFPTTAQEKTLEIKALAAQTAVNQWALSHHLITVSKAQAQAKNLIKTNIESQVGGSKGLTALLQHNHLTVAGLQQYVTNQMISASAFTKVTKGVKPPTTAQEQAYYQKNKSTFTNPQQDEISDIVVKTQSIANSVLTQAKKGANFASLAKKYSIASSGKTGGNLGYLPLTLGGSMSQGMYSAVANLKAGQFSTYHGTQGYHVIDLVATKPASQQPFSQVQSQIKTTMAQSSDNAVYQAFTTKLEKTIKVKIIG